MGKLILPVITYDKYLPIAVKRSDSGAQPVRRGCVRRHGTQLSLCLKPSKGQKGGLGGERSVPVTQARQTKSFCGRQAARAPASSPSTFPKAPPRNLSTFFSQLLPVSYPVWLKCCFLGLTLGQATPADVISWLPWVHRQVRTPETL